MDLKKKTKRLVIYTVLFLLVLFSVILIWQLGLIEFAIPPDWTHGSGECHINNQGFKECRISCSLWFSPNQDKQCYYYFSELNLEDDERNCDRWTEIEQGYVSTNCGGVDLDQFCWSLETGHSDDVFGIHGQTNSPPYVDCGADGVWATFVLDYIPTTTLITTTTMRVYPNGESTFILIAIVMLSIVLVGSLFYFRIIKL